MEKDISLPKGLNAEIQNGIFSNHIDDVYDF